MSSRPHVNGQRASVMNLQAQANAYFKAHPDAAPKSIGRDHKIAVDGKVGKQTRDAVAAMRRDQTAPNRALHGKRGATPTTRQAGMRSPRSSGTDSKRPRVATEARARPAERTTEAAPARRARGGRVEFASIPAASPNHGIRHITQPDSTSCKPTTTRMIQNAGGHVGSERVGPGENMRLTGDTMRRFVNQVQTTGVMAGVRSRSPGGAIRGSENGHVICVTGYKIVDSSGRPVSDAAARAAMAKAGGWDNVNGALAAEGLHMRLTTKDPGTSGAGAESYLDVGRDGRMHRPALGGGRVSQGDYTVRYLMLD